ncbi:hypothetical protein Bpfe_018223, partial [Biomphalaria pfeifferi]
MGRVELKLIRDMGRVVEKLIRDMGRVVDKLIGDIGRWNINVSQTWGDGRETYQGYVE